MPTPRIPLVAAMGFAGFTILFLIAALVSGRPDDSDRAEVAAIRREAGSVARALPVTETAELQRLLEGAAATVTRVNRSLPEVMRRLDAEPIAEAAAVEPEASIQAVRRGRREVEEARVRNARSTAVAAVADTTLARAEVNLRILGNQNLALRGLVSSTRSDLDPWAAELERLSARLDSLRATLDAQAEALAAAKRRSEALEDRAEPPGMLSAGAGGPLSVIGALLSLIGSVLSMVVAWRQERRDSRRFMLEYLKLNSQLKGDQVPAGD